MNSSISITELPNDIFLLVLDFLDAWDVVRGRRVSKKWLQSCVDTDHLRYLLKKYALAREVQPLLRRRLLDQTSHDLNIPWLTVFDRLACRYFHLSKAKASSAIFHETPVSEKTRSFNWFPVHPWDYHNSQPGGRLVLSDSDSPFASFRGATPHLFSHCFWSYEDGLLALPQGLSSNTYAGSNIGSLNFVIVIVDLETSQNFRVPFNIQGKVVRNFRLLDRTLVIEWAEMDAFHRLNESEQVHRHFATCFDVISEGCEYAHGVLPSPDRRWTIAFRNEWKLHFLGLPLNTRDRFFSTHNKQHYSIYFWQPNRSMYTGDEERPIESLFVLDISAASTYQPSTDPTSHNRPRDYGTNNAGPQILARFSFRELDHFGVRQHNAPSLTKLMLDSEAKAVIVRENICVEGQGYFDPALRSWKATTTSIPFVGEGPHFRKEWDGYLPPYRGNCTMETEDIVDPEWDKNFLGIMDVVDWKAEVRFTLTETVFGGHTIPNETLLKIECLGQDAVTMRGDLTKQVAHMGRIQGDERFLIGQNATQEIVVLSFQ